MKTTLLVLAALLALGLAHRAWPEAAPPGPAGSASPEAPGASDPLGLRGARGRVFHVAGDDPRADDGNDGSPGRPWKTLGRAAALGVLRPGDVVYVRAGLYREAVTPHEGGTGPEARVTFAAWPGESVVISGADPADAGWERAGPNLWRRAWEGEGLRAYNGDPVFRRELLVAGGHVLRPVFRREALEPGTFYVEGTDAAPRFVVARFPGDRTPSEAGPVELGTRAFLFRPRGPREHVPCGDPSTPGWFRLVGITFRYAANRAQWGAVCTGREGALFEDVTVEWTNGRGFDTDGTGHVLRRTHARFNGQTGYGGACSGCLLEDGSAVGNNWKGHDPFWEAGGGKWAGTRETVFRRMRFEDNEGPGLWLDGDNADNTVEDGWFARNLVAGIMLELATVRTLVQHNHVSGTRWRAWSGTGILSQAASANVLMHNDVYANEGTGLWLRLDPERRAPDGRNVVHANRVVGNARRAGVEAREVAVEGLSPAHVRTTRWSGNVYGAHAGDPLFRSTFYLHPVDGAEAGLRSNDLAAWQRLAAGDAAARLVSDRLVEVPVRAPGPLRAGAALAPPRPAARAGAAPPNFHPTPPSP
ncbi:MAG: right-handed parallel beta-helix repeat-containing protein [Rubricoccaceae bacterium]